MISSKRYLPGLQRRKLRAASLLLRRLHFGPGFLTLVLLLGAVSFLVTFEWQSSVRKYETGDVAEADIVADRSFRYLDEEATQQRREAVAKAQPLIGNLNVEPVDKLHSMIQELCISVNKAASDATALEALRISTSDKISEEILPKDFALLTSPEVQEQLTDDIMPWLEDLLRKGVLSDVRVASGYGGIVVRDANGAQVGTLKPGEALGLREVLLDLSLHIRSLKASAQAKRLYSQLLENQILPTLTPNLEATAQRAQDAAKAVQPVMQDVVFGEVILRQGDRVDHDHLTRLQAMWKYSSKPVNVTSFLGVWMCSLLLCSGLFFSPSERKLGRVQQKDLVFIGSLAAFMALLAKAFYVLGFYVASMSPGFTAGAQLFAVPVAGAVGLAAMASPTRRTYIISFLLAFFCAIAGKGGASAFIFYFMTSMLSVWLFTDSQSRKEVVWAIVPLALGMLLVWVSLTLLWGGDPQRFLAEGLSVLLGALFSLMVIFTMSPIVEMAFGFTTRFALMELLNQEHPLIRALMINAPGTYHHSVIVSSLAENAAKAIGAHSLLCKTAGVYHDVGKLDRPEYFIENQFRGINPHDNLKPAMSALVIIAHVKRGTELAAKYRLGPEITDIIAQHHGNRVLQYFYQKALAQEGSVQPEAFSYAGPKPQTREAALIMLADVVEASARTLENPTPGRIKAHIYKMVRSVLAEGQLDEVDLTFRDMERVVDAFSQSLTGIFHKRIEYPGQNKSGEGETDKNAAQSEADKPAAAGAAAPIALPAQPKLQPVSATLHASYLAAPETQAPRPQEASFWLEPDRGVPAHQARQKSKGARSTQSSPGGKALGASRRRGVQGGQGAAFQKKFSSEAVPSTAVKRRRLHLVLGRVARKPRGGLFVRKREKS